MSFELKDFKEVLYREVDHFKENGRTESANFLLWFLKNYFRLDEDYAIQYICDQQNDKGIDGIFVDDNTQEIFVFQVKFYENFSKNQGDNDLRNFVGAIKWFTAENIKKLDNSKACRELKDLVNNLNVFDNLEQGFNLNPVFITTGYFDRNAKDYIGITNDIFDYWDCHTLFDKYTYSEKDDFVRSKFEFNTEDNIIEYRLHEENPAYIFTVKAKDVLRLNGITDRTLFSKNVRYGLGRTRVNKDIKKTILDKNQHTNFLFYHNGITLITEKANYQREDRILTIENYSIVNGCQSTLTLYENKNEITDELKLILKVIVTGEDSNLGEKITYYANNQNPISLSDLFSRDKFQMDLQEKFNNTFNNKILYKIKPGENESGYNTVIENTFAAQLIYSFVNGKPNEAHLKTQIFTNYHMQIFSRNVDEYLIYLLFTFYKIIENNIIEIKEPTIRSYKLTLFFILFLFKRIMKLDDLWDEFFKSYKNFYEKYQDKIPNAFSKLSKLLMIDFNYHIDDKKSSDDYIDYKNLLRNSEEMNKLADLIIKGYEKNLVHHPEDELKSLLSQ